MGSQMIGSHKINLRISVNWLVLVLLLAISLIIAYIFISQDLRHYIVFSASVLAGAGAALAAVNALDARFAQLQQSKALNALDFAHKWTDPALFHARKAGRETLQFFKGKTLVQQKAYLDEDATRLANLIDVLNFFETLSVAIHKDIADEEMSRRWFRSVLNEYWHTAQDFVKNRRAERNNARLLVELEWLFERWKA